jgi:chromosome segregation ATPase
MSDLLERLRVVQEQVTGLVKERDTLRKRASTLEHQAREHQQTAGVLQARITELEREIEVLRTARAAQGAGTTDAKQRIDELVNEIDRCLALIGA